MIQGSLQQGWGIVSKSMCLNHLIYQSEPLAIRFWTNTCFWILGDCTLQPSFRTRFRGTRLVYTHHCISGNKAKYHQLVLASLNHSQSVSRLWLSCKEWKSSMGPVQRKFTQLIMNMYLNGYISSINSLKIIYRQSPTQ